MNTESILDSLTDAVKLALQGKAIVNVTKQNLSRAYALSGATSSSNPFGRWQVHVVAVRDTLKATVIYNDYGPKGKGGSSSARQVVTLDNVTDLGTQIGQFLSTGQRG